MKFFDKVVENRMTGRLHSGQLEFVDHLQRKGLFTGDVDASGEANGFGVWKGEDGREARGTFS